MSKKFAFIAILATALALPATGALARGGGGGGHGGGGGGHMGGGFGGGHMGGGFGGYDYYDPCWQHPYTYGLVCDYPY